MKKWLFPIMLGLTSMFVMSSCESDEPSFGGGEPINTNVNNWLYNEIFKPNYLWDVSESANLDQGTEALFNSLKNPADNVSELWQSSGTTTPTTSYSIGFEYGINKYSDGKVYYVVYYVIEGSSADLQGLRRGRIITEVNGVEPQSEEDAKQLLANAYKDGNPVKLTYVIPPASDTKTIEVEPSIASIENPIYTSQIIPLLSGSDLGYIVYNSFTPGMTYTDAAGKPANDFRYDNALADKFQEFANAGIEYLILDLRYNAGGTLSSSAVLASAMVKDRVDGDNFILFDRDRTTASSIEPVKMIGETFGGVQIPRLGNQLKGVYIITGAYTAGASNVFINSLQAYLPELKIVGEKTQATPNIYIGTSSKEGWFVSLALAYMANKNNQYSYANGISPQQFVNEVPTDRTVLIKPLGDPEELVLNSIISDILGFRTVSVPQEYGSVTTSYSSTMQKPWANKSLTNIEDLN